jgi:CheY-like chemotaxis protein
MPRVSRKNIAKTLQDKRILIVEDQPLVGELLTELLRRYDHPSQATSGKDALEQIKGNAPDLILLDLHLRDMHGLEVARLVRRNEQTRHTPILAMSASSLDYKKCLAVGCNDFIHKPFSISTLLVRLAAMVHSDSGAEKCPVMVNRKPCGLQLCRIGTLDESFRPSFDVYECGKGHQTYHLSKTKN